MGIPGLEPRLMASKTIVLSITLYTLFHYTVCFGISCIDKERHEATVMICFEHKIVGAGFAVRKFSISHTVLTVDTYVIFKPFHVDIVTYMLC